RLVPGDGQKQATNTEIIEMYNKRLIPLLVDDQGKLKTFQEAGINEEEYIAEYKKAGYYKQPYKLLYKIFPNDPKDGNSVNLEGAEGWVFPVNGMGLWDAIYGYLAVGTDGVNVIGASWYDQKETPGLGANISEESWQSLFPGKKVFLESATGDVDTKTAPLGIVVVKGKVSEVYGDSPKSHSAVDGMAGATLTGNGVTDAYRDVLAGYRPFLELVHAANKKN
ncbi:MAG: NADH:ubiquinone reductase (Na(+)-transporting) subunit C, partial [Parachlamydiaceae bacterium]|nr:NADH:ubiquinone reductase (Na(+)-transporting) subunit C [Parachlamydiaceae bacterium]